MLKWAFRLDRHVSPGPDRVRPSVLRPANHILFALVRYAELRPQLASYVAPNELLVTVHASFIVGQSRSQAWMLMRKNPLHVFCMTGPRGLGVPERIDVPLTYQFPDCCSEGAILANLTGH